MKIEDLAKQMLKKLLILVIASTVGISSSCSAASKHGGGSSAANITETADNKTADDSQTNAKEISKTDSTKQTDIFAAFKKGDDYQQVVRPKILKDDWEPARSADGYENCEYETPICNEYLELEAGPAARLGNIVFRWKKGDKILLIYTLGDPPVFENYEFEKVVKQPNEPDVLGKYECCEIGVSGERKLEVKSKYIAVFNERDEGSTATGNGLWSWDAKKQFINVNLTVKWKFDGGEKIETKTSKVSFQLKKDGNDLKIVKETLSSPGLSGYYIGKTFKKQ